LSASSHPVQKEFSEVIVDDVTISIMASEMR
jgi:hypothetical protein